MLADGSADLDVSVSIMSNGTHSGCSSLSLDNGLRGCFGERVDAIDGPGEVDGGGAAGSEGLGDDLEVGVERRDGGGGALLDADGDAHGSADADGGCSANDHGGDGVGDFVIGGCKDVDFFQRQAGLIEKADAFGGPFEGGNHLL